MDTEIYELIEPDVEIAARTTAREWPGIVDQEEAAQEIWLVLLDASAEALSRVVEMDRPQRVSALTTYGHRIASRERDDHDLFAGNFFYGVGHVQALLDADGLLDLEREDPGSMTTTERIDLQIAYARLREKNARYAFLVDERYVQGVSFAHDDPDRKACERAVTALTREMNRSFRSRQAAYEGPGSRTR